MQHDFDEYGSLASECRRCRTAFTYGTDHRQWKAIPCRINPYTLAERLAHGELYRRTFPIYDFERVTA